MTTPFIPCAVQIPPAPLGSLALIRAGTRNMLETIPAQAYSARFLSLRNGLIRWHIASHPDSVRHIHRDHVQNYVKAPVMHHLLGPWMGESLFLAEGEDWRKRRRILAAALRPAALMKYGDAILAEARGMAERIAARLGQGPVDMTAEARTVALDVVRATMFRDFDRVLMQHQGLIPAGMKADEIRDWHGFKAQRREALRQFLQRVGDLSLFELLNLPRWLPRPGLMFRPNPMHEIFALVDAFVARARAENIETNDILGLLLAARDPETGEALTNRQVRDDLVTMIIVGFDTTALALSWACYLASQQPALQEALAAEAQAAAGDPARIMSHSPLLGQLLDETLRLYPTAPMLVRKALADDEVCGHRVRKGEWVVTSIYQIHRHTALWDAPNEFRIERFAPGAPAPIKDSYLPFGIGPRVCIGPHFALMEARIVLSTLFARFHFAPHPKRVVTPAVRLTLRPRGGLPLVVRER